MLDLYFILYSKARTKLIKRSTKILTKEEILGYYSSISVVFQLNLNLKQRCLNVVKFINIQRAIELNRIDAHFVSRIFSRFATKSKT